MFVGVHDWIRRLDVSKCARVCRIVMRDVDANRVCNSAAATIHFRGFAKMLLNQGDLRSLRVYE